YELKAGDRPTLAEPIINAVRADFPIDPAAQIDGRPAHGGIIRPDLDPEKRELWSEALYLRVHHTTLGYTLETSSSFPLEKRVTAQCVAIKAAVATFR
ncbi:MAG: succinylglutamate desuccinylase, partial [Verrucomicrobiota bacterium]|nr:succinylglutamate desuccinylase [Verrucomicrobiota bacterium]